jgi:energy-coupling factor transport system ATP-binding protein
MEKIKCVDLSFKYPTSEYFALKNVNLSVQEGEVCLIIGESAVGKSTLLKLLKKEIAPSGDLSGEIIIDGTVGYVAQNVEENIVCDKVRSELSFGLLNMGLDSDTIDLLVAETASYFNLESKLDCDISSLSGGEKQMVNLASVMIMKPDVLLLDEPTSQLDPVSSDRFIQMIKRLHRDFSITILISEHNTENIYDYADNVILLCKGKLLYKSAPLDMVDYLRNNYSSMLDCVPAQARLFTGVSTVKECREILGCKDIHLSKHKDEKLYNAITVKGICFAYKKGFDVINSLSLSVYEAKINAIVGPNSSGKSTLLKLIAGVKKPYRGKIKSDLKVSMLCQNVFDLFTKDRCADEVEFGQITDYLEIDDIREQHPYDLSGGQAQRLALAKVLQTGADVILLDEPTKGFDPVIKNKFAKILADLTSVGKTILIVSHDIEFVGQYADYVSFLSRGKIITTAPRREFFSSLNFYTTAVAKITSPIVDSIVSVKDLEEAGGLK